MGQVQHGSFFLNFAAPMSADRCRPAPIFADERRANYFDRVAFIPWPITSPRQYESAWNSLFWVKVGPINRAINNHNKRKNMAKGQSNSMSKESASRIQSAGDRNSQSSTAQSGFGQRAQSTADSRASQTKGGQR
jgi:hypothetical protein